MTEHVYTVNATISFGAWVMVNAESPEAALVEAQSYPASMWDYDTGTGELEFNVTPEVEAS